MNDNRRGNWFQTRSGGLFWPLDPRPEDVKITDIASHLSKLCRFNGACKDFYSVAQHSVIVSYVVPKDYALEGLLHDASDAYIGTGCASWRSTPRRSVELHLERVIAQRFDLRFPFPCEIKEADNVLLMTERRDLMGRPPQPWTERATPLDETITPLPPEEAEAQFLARFGAIWRNRRRRGGLDRGSDLRCEACSQQATDNVSS